jgi:signal transduction histidine kinase
VVHEIDNQLVSIRGAVELIKNDFGTMADYERYQFLSTIENNVASLSNLVDELHKQARNDRTTLTERYYVDIPKVLDNIGKNNPSHQPDISISTTIGVVHLGVSDVVLESIIKSLVDNAKKVGGQNVRISIDATISDEQSNTFQVIVSDNGPGILEEHRENIFADFFTTDQEKVGGGLGLSNIKSILEVHSGRIELLTSLEGASFLVELPVIG